MQYLNQNVVLTEDASKFEMKVLNIYPQYEEQKVLGFGGAFTEASAYLYSQMDDTLKEKFMEAYFGKSGTHYNVGRIPMGSCDFALAPYSEAGKEDLSDFNIEQDRKYIIPMVRDALKKAEGKLFLFASPWSPPAFMKDTGELNFGGKLKPEYYQTYAEYFVKFLKAYLEEGIVISAVTVQNEPNAKQRWESCLVSATEEAVFAVQNLRPTLDKNGFRDVKILLWDHNRERLVERAEESFSVPGALEAVWGLGYHWYSGDHFDAMDLVRKRYPEKVLLATEFCQGHIGSFNDEKRNLEYAKEFILSLRHGSIGLCDWNLMLDPTGGPFHWRKNQSAGCNAAIYYDSEKREMITDGIYQVISTVVSGIAPGDVIIPTSCAKQELQTLAAKKENGDVSLVVLNPENEEYSFTVRMGKRAGNIELPVNSLCVFNLSAD